MNFKIFHKRKLLTFSVVILVIMSTLALFAPQFTQFSYEEQNIERRLETPNQTYWMGTDSLGRDQYSRIIYGARMSLAVGLVTAIFALMIGTVVGAISGYFGGTVDLLITRLMDLFYIFPSLLLAILFSILFGRGIFGLFLALAMTSWITQARLVRNQILQIKQMPYVESARSLGANDFRIITRHMIPNLIGTLLIALTLQIPNNIMAESLLSFLGLGLNPPYSSWGTLANEGFRGMKSYPHLIIYPGLFLFLTLFALNIIGDSLRDWFDPKTTV
jgi:oligopeptide transport system permease protein